ncbi:MAG: diguanylate cyclase [Candidatus Aminicenantes bacterium]|nr:diguanylate cyclase [Candidatus Aminicenantes bacterium]
MIITKMETQRLLLIEDNPGDVRLVREYLNESNVPLYSIDTAVSFGEMVKIFQQKNVHYDLVLLDLNLPDSTGLSTLTEAIRLPVRHPIIVLTDHGDEDLGISAIQHGAQDYLVKEKFSGKDLVRAIRYAIERHKLKEEVRRLSLFDDLTGLFNRSVFLRLVDHQIKLGLRHKRNIILFYMGVNGMKQINDTFGYKGADQILQETGKILRRTFRDSDIVARVTGDEFAAAVLEAVEGSSGILLRRLKENIEIFNQKNDKPSLELHIGWAQWVHENPATLEI